MWPVYRKVSKIAPLSQLGLGLLMRQTFIAPLCIYSDHTKVSVK